jgi:hypothetical protein
MVKWVTIAYLVTLAVLVVAGVVADLAWPVAATIGVAAMAPVAVADIVVTRRRLRRGDNASPAVPVRRFGRDA